MRGKDYVFHILQDFVTKFHNCIKFRMLFPAALIDFPNSKVCAIEEWSITELEFEMLKKS